MRIDNINWPALAAALMFAAARCVHAAGGAWNVDASGLWSDPANWAPAAVPGTTTGDAIHFTNDISSARTVTIDSTSRTTGSLTFGDPAAPHFPFILTNSGGATLTFNNGGSRASLVQTDTTAADVISVPITISDHFNISNTSTLILSGPISSGSGKTIAKSGAGTLVLSGVNTFTGGFTNLQGTVSINTISNVGVAQPLGAVPSVMLGASGQNATLRYTGPSRSTSLPFMLAAGGTGTFQIDDADTELLRTAAITGAGGLIKSGPGTLRIATTADTYSGDTRIDEGILRIDWDPVNTTFYLNGGILVNNAGSFVRPVVVTADGSGLDGINDHWYSGALTSSGGNYTLYVNTSPIATSLTYAAPVTPGPGLTLLWAVQKGSVTVRNSGVFSTPAVSLQLESAATFSLDGSSTTFGALSGSGTVDGWGGNITLGGTNSGWFSGILKAGSMNLVKTNTGTQTLSGPNTYTGGTTIKSGTLRMGASNIGTTSGALGPSTAAVTLGDSSGTNSAALLTAGPVTFANAVTVASGSSGTATLGGDTADSSVFSGAITLNKTATLTSANGGNVTFSGVLAGSGTGIIKSGEGTVTLARGNTYTGVTTVKEGTLKLGTNNALADSSKLVLAGGTFSTGGYSDSIDALTNQASSTLTLGTSGTNSITFSSAVRTTGTFSISNWTGIAGQSGTGNRIFISAAPGATFLTNITFTGYHAGAIRLGTGEVVPVLIPGPTKLAITSIEGGASPKPNKPFTVVVQAQDGTSTPWNVTNNTTVTLSLGSGSGSLSGTLTGVILAGNDSVSISGVLYSTAESGIVLTATRTSGDALFAGNSSPFTVSGWQDSSWTRRIAITIDKTKVAGPLTNFPVLISVTNSALQQYARSDGYDLMFTAADGATKLAHEIESYTSSNGVLVAWVNVPILPSTTDTTLYLYFGNSASTNQQDITGTWSPEFKAVWHMNGVFTDSTSNSFNGTNTGTLDASAKMAGGRSFVRANGVDYITAGGLLGTPVNATIGAWIHLSSVDNNGCEIISLGDHLLLRHGTTSIVGIFYDGSWRTFSVNTSLVGTGWRYLAMTFDDAANSQKIYLDGLPIASASYSGSISYAGLGGNTFIGKHGNGLSGYAFDGTMDEVRVAATARSADWIWTEFNNQSATATFYSVGPDQVGNAAPTVESDSVQRHPTSGAKVRIATLLANDSDPDGDSISFHSLESTTTGGGTAAAGEGWVYYTPPDGFTNADAFKYVVADLSLLATGSIAINITADVDPSRNTLPPENLGNGDVRSRFFGIPQRSYTIQSTTNTVSPVWTTLGTATADAVGQFEFIDTPPPDSPERVYRSIYLWNP